jgi:predicted alpha/beta-fold hydrolase
VQETSPGWLTPYRPMFSSSHVQTLAGNYWRRRPFSLKAQPEIVQVDAENNSRVLCHCHWQPEDVRAERLTILLVHGLEGSSDSRYMLGITERAWAAGLNVVRMNMRNCGGTETLTPTLYHSGLSADVGAVLRHFVARYELQRVAMAGYSMGGNLVLKLAGEMSREAPGWLKGVVGVSAATDLGPSADALHEPSNRAYEWHFLRNLMGRFRRKAQLFPEIYSTAGAGPVRTIREFDDKITARYNGFADADDYYFRASSARVIEKIAVPALALHALDDPFIRMLPSTRAAITANKKMTLIETAHGGHCAFLSANSLPSRHWAEETLVGFLLEVAGQGSNGG